MFINGDVCVSGAFLTGFILTPDNNPNLAIYLDFLPLQQLSADQISDLQSVDVGQAAINEVYSFIASHYPEHPIPAHITQAAAATAVTAQAATAYSLNKYPQL